MKNPTLIVANSLPSRMREKIHVLEVLGNAIVGGMENYVRNLIANLPRDEFEVTVLCPFESAYTGMLRDMGRPVYIAPLRDDPPWRSIEMICNLIQVHGIDIVHAHLMNAHTVAAVAGHLMSIPTVATIHGMSLHAQEISQTRLCDSNLIVVCRDAWSQALALGVPLEKLMLVPNGVDLDIFHPGAAPRSVFREAIGIGDDAFLIGFVGRLAWEKGPDKFVRAAQLVLSQRPNVHFAMVGTGAMEMELRQVVDNSGIGKHVHLAGLWNEPQLVYPSLDLMLHTSRADAMPLVLLEAMASGVPVVAIGVGGIPELIADRESGMLIGTNEWPGIVSEYPGDWEGVGKAAIHLIDSPRLLKKMSSTSVARAEALFDIRKSARLTADFLRSLAGPIREKSGHNGTGVMPVSLGTERAV